MRLAKLIVAVVIGVVVLCGALLATVTWGNLFKTTYKPDAQSALARAKCRACHVKTNGTGGLNCYGKLLKGKAVEAASLRAIEQKDPDGDTFKNIKEINAGTLPGDPDSKPASQ